MATRLMMKISLLWDPAYLYPEARLFAVCAPFCSILRSAECRTG
jgi:hypothetical protein